MSGSRDSTLASATSFPDYDFPVYLVDGRSSLAPVTVPGKPRVLVISIPKSGTYLLAAYLKKLGLVDTGIHIDLTSPAGTGLSDICYVVLTLCPDGPIVRQVDRLTLESCESVMVMRKNLEPKLQQDTRLRG